MFKTVAALCLLSLPTVSAGLVDIPFTSCGTSADHITIASAQANIWPPQAGQPLNLVLSGSTDEVISAGTYEAKVTFDWIPVLDKTGSIGDLVTLPIQKGPTTIQKTVTLPSSIPSGSVSIHVTANDQSGDELVCVDISAQLGKQFPTIIVHNFGFESLNDVDVPYTNCGSPSDILNITSLTASVWPPVAGQALTVSGVGTSSETITGGSFEATVSYLGIQLIDKKGDLASVTTLPFPAGPASLTKTVALPSSLPSGPYSIQASAVDQSGKSIGCVGLEFSL